MTTQHVTARVPGLPVIDPARLRGLLAERRMRQKAFAAAAGISHYTLGDVLNEDRVAGPRVALRIAAACRRLGLDDAFTIYDDEGLRISHAS